MTSVVDDNLDFEVVIGHLSEEDGGGYVATVSELPGCMSDGDTQEEALANVRDAIASWVATAAELGRNIPAPR